MTWAEWAARLDLMSRSALADLTPAEAGDLRRALLAGVAEGARVERERLAAALRAEGHPGSVLGRLAAGYDANGSEAT